MLGDQELKHWSASRQGWLCPVVVLAAALCISGSPAMAQDSGSEAGEGAESEAAAENVPDEESNGQAEEQAEEEDRSETPRWDGAAARRELLFRDRQEQRGTQFPEGLVPKPGVERSDLGAFDARQRGRFAALPQDGHAGWFVDATVAVQAGYEDNPLLERPEETGGISTEAWAYEVAPRLRVTHRSARTMFQSVVRLSYDALEPFEEDSRLDDLDSFDQHGGFQFDAYGQRTTLSFFGNIANTTTRTALVEEIGRELSDDRVLTYGGGGSMSHATSPTSELQVSVAGRWQELESELLSDSVYFQAAADYRSRISRADMVGVAGLYERFMPERADFPDVSIVTGLANWSHQFSAAMSMNLEGGAQFIISESNDALADQNTKIDAFARASLYWAVSQWDGVSIRATRSAEPNATGETRTTDRIQLAYQRQLGRGISVGVPLAVTFQDSALGDGVGNRRFLQVAPNLVWAFKGGWGLSAQYRYRLENQDGLSDASSNSVYLTLTYTGTRWKKRMACPGKRPTECN